MGVDQRLYPLRAGVPVDGVQQISRVLRETSVHKEDAVGPVGGDDIGAGTCDHQ